MDRPLEFRRLSETTGAEVIGFDFRVPPSDEVKRAWHGALDAFQLLVFRDAAIDAETQVRMLASLGPPLIENETGRPYQFVSNAREDGILGDAAFAFHSDHAFMPDPIDTLSLYGLEIPPSGTQTRFANGLAAARALPDALRGRLEGLRARHIIDPAGRSDTIPVRRPRLPDDLPHAHHLVLSRHPRTQAPILYVSEQQTDRVASLPDEESRVLLETLFDHLYAPRFAYHHDWREGDLVVWDNRALQHAREAIPTGIHRTLRRVAVGGTSVYEFFERHAQWRLD